MSGDWYDPAELAEARAWASARGGVPDGETVDGLLAAYEEWCDMQDDVDGERSR